MCGRRFGQISQIHAGGSGSLITLMGDLAPMLSNVTAAILAGGLGTRLRSIIADRPKVLAEVGGRPFIEYLLDQLAVAGLRTVVLCTGFMGEQVQLRFRDSYRGMRLHYSLETSPLGTGGALRLALPRLTSPVVMVMNGDSYCDAKLDAFAAWHQERASRATILLTETPDTRRYGRVQVRDDGRIERFQEKADMQGPGWINAGIYLLSRDLIETIPTGRPVSIERDMFPEWLKGVGLAGYRSEGRLWDIGVPDAYARANADFVEFIASTHIQ
jgi:D-glycero-alpha-D-manno-heptose 1-phosphate guanylyltransferase